MAETCVLGPGYLLGCAEGHTLKTDYPGGSHAIDPGPSRSHRRVRIRCSPGRPFVRPDPFWPKPFPGNWILGQVAGLATDRNDRIWIVHRPKSLLDDEKGATQNPPATKCCTAAPPVMEFDADGNLLRSWGGSGQGYDWPQNEHGIFVDKDGSVWVGGNSKEDHHILKFAPDGKFLMQIGKPGSSKDQLADPARPARAHGRRRRGGRTIRRRRLP